VEICKIDEKFEPDGQKTVIINAYKYDMIKQCVDRIIESDEEIDEENVLFGVNETPVAFKLAYNSLIFHEILKKVKI
jgi:hypothetical protein